MDNLNQTLSDSNLLLTFLIQWGFRIATAGLIFFLGWIGTRFLTRLLTRYMERYDVDPLLLRFATSMAQWTLLALVAIIALGTLGINTTSLIAMLGAAGLAVGLALQDSLKNFASGVLIILFRPFRVGDYVEAGNVAGMVDEVSAFSTVLNTPDNRRVIVPNGAIYTTAITNYSSHATRRIDLVVGIGYEDDIRSARRILQGLVDADDRVLRDPEPVIAVDALADSSVNLLVRIWVVAADYWQVKWDFTEQIKLAFDDQGISIPYPQIDVHTH